MWRETVASLGSGRRVLTPEFSGFGGAAPRGDEPSLDRFAEEVFALLDREGLRSVVLGGLSMGGYVAMTCLRQQPERVRALVLADTKASADPPEGSQKRLTMADRLERDATTDALVEGVLPALVGSTTRASRPDVMAQVTDAVRAASPQGAAWAQRAMAARPDSFGDLRAFPGPALVVRGDEDELSTAADVDAMVTALPDGRLVTLSGSGHLPAVEVPDEFARALREFLDALPQ